MILTTTHKMVGKVETIDLVHDTLDLLGCDETVCPVKYSNRMTRSMGTASCRWVQTERNLQHKSFLITLSNILMPLVPREEQIETIVHEACHIATYVRGERGHGRLWKQYMRECGYEPRRCHNVTYGHIAKCDCKSWILNNRKANRQKQCPVFYRCPSCKKNLKLTGKKGARRS